MVVESTGNLKQNHLYLKKIHKSYEDKSSTSFFDKKKKYHDEYNELNDDKRPHHIKCSVIFYNSILVKWNGVLFHYMDNLNIQFA